MPPIKPPRISYQFKTLQASLEKKYIVPLATMIFGKKVSFLILNKNFKFFQVENINYGSTLTTLNAQLRKVHCEITQIETVGKRLEAQIIRAINNGN